MCVYLFTIIIALQCLKDRLEEENISKMIKLLYDEINLKKSKYNYMRYPFRMIRFIVVLVYPSIFISSPGLRIMVIININMASFVEYVSARPHIGLPKYHLFWLNEFLIVLFSYDLMFFSDFIQDLEMKYLFGYVHILIITFCLLTNMAYLGDRTYSKKLSANKKT